MPTLRVNGVELYYEDTGESHKEPIVFSHALWLSGRMFDAQVSAFSSRYRCIVYDHRGQGRSEITPIGYDMETLYEDAAHLVQALNAAPCHFVGATMGGYIGMRLAARRPQLVKSLILIGSSADREPDYLVRQMQFAQQVLRWLGPRWIIEPTIKQLFGQQFLTDPAHAIQVSEIRRQLATLNRQGMRHALKGVLSRRGVFEELSNIQAPTLVLIGDEDLASMSEKSNRLVSKIPNATSALIAGAGYSPTIEQPVQVNNLMSVFLNNRRTAVST